MLFRSSPDHKKELSILLKELEDYDPELLHKQMIVGISKSDLLDEELKAAIRKEISSSTPLLFFSAITGEGITELKDQLWLTLNPTK